MRPLYTPPAFRSQIYRLLALAMQTCRKATPNLVWQRPLASLAREQSRKYPWSAPGAEPILG